MSIKKKWDEYPRNKSVIFIYMSISSYSFDFFGKKEGVPNMWVAK